MNFFIGLAIHKWKWRFRNWRLYMQYYWNTIKRLLTKRNAN